MGEVRALPQTVAPRRQMSLGICNGMNEICVSEALRVTPGEWFDGRVGEAYLPCSTRSVLAVRAWTPTTARATCSSVVRTTTPNTTSNTQPTGVSSHAGRELDQPVSALPRDPPVEALRDANERYDEEADADREPGDRGDEVDDAERQHHHEVDERRPCPYVLQHLEDSFDESIRRARVHRPARHALAAHGFEQTAFSQGNDACHADEPKEHGQSDDQNGEPE